MTSEGFRRRKSKYFLNLQCRKYDAAKTVFCLASGWVFLDGHFKRIVNYPFLTTFTHVLSDVPGAWKCKDDVLPVYTFAKLLRRHATKTCCVRVQAHWHLRRKYKFSLALFSNWAQLTKGNFPDTQSNTERKNRCPAQRLSLRASYDSATTKPIAN